MTDFYSGGELVTLQSGRTVSLAEAVQILEVDPIIRRFGTWAVTEYGVECLVSRCWIEKERIYDSDLPHRMVGNGSPSDRGHWVVRDDFLAALDFARTYFQAQSSLGPKRPEPITTPGITRRPRQLTLSNRLRFLVMKRDRSICQLCGRSAKQGYQMQVDHKIPRAKGGSDDLENLQVLCSVCNNGKGTSDL